MQESPLTLSQFKCELFLDYEAWRRDAMILTQNRGRIEGLTQQATMALPLKAPVKIEHLASVAIEEMKENVPPQVPTLSHYPGKRLMQMFQVPVIKYLEINHRCIQLGFRTMQTIGGWVEDLATRGKALQTLVVWSADPDDDATMFMSQCKIFTEPQRVDHETLVTAHTPQRCT